MNEKSCSTCRYQDKGEDEAPCVKCSKRYQNNYTPMTNADRIRQMTDEELAEVIMCHMGDWICDDAHIDMSCIECTLRWLKEEVAT